MRRGKGVGCVGRARGSPTLLPPLLSLAVLLHIRSTLRLLLFRCILRPLLFLLLTHLPLLPAVLRWQLLDQRAGGLVSERPHPRPRHHPVHGGFEQQAEEPATRLRRDVPAVFERGLRRGACERLRGAHSRQTPTYRMAKHSYARTHAYTHQGIHTHPLRQPLLSSSPPTVLSSCRRMLFSRKTSVYCSRPRVCIPEWFSAFLRGGVGTWVRIVFALSHTCAP